MSKAERRRLNEIDAHPVGNHSQIDGGPESVVSTVSDEAPQEVELIAENHALSVITALAEGPKACRELVEVCGGSRSTVYRRVNDLADAGFVVEETKLDPGGHHCKRFRLARDKVHVTIEEDGITFEIE
jgi:predicted transcriptional regulator